MRRPGLLLAAGAATFLLFLVAFLPATVLPRALPPELGLEGLEGTVWRGSARDVAWRGQSLGGLRWSNRPWRLAALELDYALRYEPPGGGVDLRLAASRGGRLELSDLRGSLPVEPFQGLIAARGWTGRIDLDVERVLLRDGRPVEAAGRVVAKGLTAPYGNLGDFELLLGEGSVGGEGVSGRLRDLGTGPLRVRATIKLDATGQYLMSGEAATAAGADPRIERALLYLGPPDSLGRRSFSIEGTL